MRKHNLKLGAKYACENFVTKGNYKAVNIHMSLWKELLENNYPLIKKKIVNQLFDPIYEKHVASRIDAQSAKKFIEIYKDKNFKINL
jgi:hypothetical protein